MKAFTSFRPTRPGAVLAGLALLWLAGPAGAGVLELSFNEEDSPEPVADVVVMVTSPQSVSPVQAVMGQKNRAFVPDLLVVPRGSEVNFPNNDNTQHHVYSFSAAKTFNIELYADEPPRPITFDTVGIVELGCNIHDTMQAFIVVTGTPHVARSGAAGIARLEVPDQLLDSDGKLAVRIWHPRLPDNTSAQTLSLSGPFPIRQRLALELTPEPADTDGFGGLQERFRNL
ncbi:MAG: methylamine utilization protein [Marinobacter sp.]|uniref:methylamine utilization protein n=1 Tax=Marinobacter sp. TaxID=50741 RepID=UPI00299F2CDB|nr:methylamine utilization protein [Marinobacter sp.]MDX1634145.1 methylamine utilization protein [Marinobacter sp.]